jgi:hypothetical protein
MIAMNGFPDDLRAVLRTLAEARDGPFYNLYVDLTHAWPGPSADIGFRIHKVADTTDVMLSVGASVNPPGALYVGWSVALMVEPERLTVTGMIEADEAVESTREVFKLNSEARTAEEAAELIRQYSEEVCAQRAWIGYGRPS